jgi:peptidoglycan hydrolase-like protein with peptidoglycan-binding domain
MKSNSRSLLVFVVACGLSWFSRISSAQDAQDEQGAVATPETPEPVQEEALPPAGSAPVDGGEVQQQNINQDASGARGKTQKHGNGSENAGMTGVQEALNRSGAELIVDGKYGQSTKMALKKFQTKNKLKPTGQADKATKLKLGLAL